MSIFETCFIKLLLTVCVIDISTLTQKEMPWHSTTHAAQANEHQLLLRSQSENKGCNFRNGHKENSFQIPGWIPVMVAVGMFIYQTLDAIDGKQARRTGSSNALGELFDHGCDSISNRKNS